MTPGPLLGLYLEPIDTGCLTPPPSNQATQQPPPPPPNTTTTTPRSPASTVLRRPFSPQGPSANSTLVFRCFLLLCCLVSSALCARTLCKLYPRFSLRSAALLLRLLFSLRKDPLQTLPSFFVAFCCCAASCSLLPAEGPSASSALQANHQACQPASQLGSVLADQQAGKQACWQAYTQACKPAGEHANSPSKQTNHRACRHASKPREPARKATMQACTPASMLAINPVSTQASEQASKLKPSKKPNESMLKNKPKAS